MPYPNRMKKHPQEMDIAKGSAAFVESFQHELLRMIGLPGGHHGFVSFTEGAASIPESRYELMLRYCEKFQQDPLQEFFSQALRLAASELASVYLKEKKVESEEIRSLKKEIQALKKRLDAYDAMFEEAQRLDKEIEAEIEAIEAEPVNPLDYKPEDWLPTPEEREKLLEDE